MTKERRKTVREWLYITAGILIMSAGIYFFKFPNHFSTGGVTGIAIVLGHYIPSLTPATLVTVINVALLILGFAVIGKSFGIRTVYASLLMFGTLYRGAIRLQGEGVYTHEGKSVLMAVVSRHEAVLLRNFIRSHDPAAFLIITSSTEIIGKGFRGVA